MKYPAFLISMKFGIPVAGRFYSLDFTPFNWRSWKVKYEGIGGGIRTRAIGPLTVIDFPL